VNIALALSKHQKRVAVLDADGEVVGTTRFGHLDPYTRRAEIGWTWYARRVQRTAVNTEAKRLLLAHAFGTGPGELGCVAPGALADLILVDGDPLSDIGLLEARGEHLALIVRGGEVVKQRPVTNPGSRSVQPAHTPAGLGP
jgi:hypothetical protein